MGRKCIGLLLMAMFVCLAQVKVSASPVHLQVQNAPTDARTAAEELASQLKADVVTVLGNTFVLFKRNPQHIRIELPTRKNELN